MLHTAFRNHSMTQVHLKISNFVKYYQLGFFFFLYSKFKKMRELAATRYISRSTPAELRTLVKDVSSFSGEHPIHTDIPLAYKNTNNDHTGFTFIVMCIVRYKCTGNNLNFFYLHSHMFYKIFYKMFIQSLFSHECQPLVLMRKR